MAEIRAHSSDLAKVMSEPSEAGGSTVDDSGRTLGATDRRCKEIREVVPMGNHVDVVLRSYREGD